MFRPPFIPLLFTGLIFAQAAQPEHNDFHANAIRAKEAISRYAVHASDTDDKYRTDAEKATARF
ncbi:MAG: hypothetical protein ACJ71Q_08950 [Terriglobales bacterium]